MVQSNGKKGYQCGYCGAVFETGEDCKECHDNVELCWFTDDIDIVLHREDKEELNSFI